MSLADSCQEISVEFVGKKDEPVSLLIEFRGELADFPSVANAFRARNRRGRLVWGRADLRAKLRAYELGVFAACRQSIGYVPQFNERIIALVGLGAVNSRKDIDNCFKGVIDHALERSGVVRNDKLVLIIPLPLWWYDAAPREYSFIFITRWRNVENLYRRFVRSILGDVQLRGYVMRDD